MSLRPPDKLYPGNPLAGILRANERRARKAGNPFGDTPPTVGADDAEGLVTVAKPVS